eukprot:s2430_g4.t1
MAQGGPGPADVEAERAQPGEGAEGAERAGAVGPYSRPSASMALWRRWGRGVLQQRGQCPQEDLLVQPAQPVQRVQQVQYSNNTQLSQLSQPACAVCDASKADSPRPAAPLATSLAATSSAGSAGSTAPSLGLGGLGLVERLQRKRGDSKGGSHDLLDHADHQANPAQGTDADAADAAEGRGDAGGFGPDEAQESKKPEDPRSNSETLQPESLTDEELGSWMQFFGLKPSGSRQFMIRRLHDILDYIDGGIAWLQSIREAPTPQKASKATKRKKSLEQGEKSPKTSRLEKSSPKAKAKPKATSPKATSPALDASSVSPDAKYEKKLDLVADAIRKDKDLYAKLLTFEPLEVREVKRRIVEIAPELRSLGEQRLRKYLDEQGFASAMQFSPFNKPFKEDIDAWAEKLLYVSECLDGWLKVQRAWMYLQPIFDSPDIMKQLPTEGKKFRLVDSKWRQTMARLHQNGAALQACSMEGLLETWNNANADLDMVQKGLDDYLETKRGAFARFYFLSNDELLEILSQTKDPLRVQPFLSKVFEAMKKLTFTSELSATQMVSKEGEIIDFVSPVHTTGKNVEIWMTEVENQMLAAIREVIKIGVESYVDTPRTEWVLKQPGQVCLNSSQVHWTAEVEEAIESAALSGYFEKLSDQLMGLVRLVRGDISKLQRMSIGALIVIDVHAKANLGR